MNIGEIAERFISAARIDLNSGSEAGPRRLKAMALPYTHSMADMNGWGTERLVDERKAFWERVNGRPTAADISEADETRSWLASVPDASQRQCLLAWADAAAGFGTFKAWCFRQGIHPETGTRRKNRALEHISRVLFRRMGQHSESFEVGVLPEDRKIGDKGVILPIDAPARSEDKLAAFAWAMDDAFLSVISGSANDFRWAEKRNELRRQRDQRKRQAA